jgi:hypothetical protein
MCKMQRRRPLFRLQRSLHGLLQNAAPSPRIAHSCDFSLFSSSRHTNCCCLPSARCHLSLSAHHLLPDSQRRSIQCGEQTRFAAAEHPVRGAGAQRPPPEQREAASASTSFLGPGADPVGADLPLPFPAPDGGVLNRAPSSSALVGGAAFLRCGGGGRGGATTRQRPSACRWSRGRRGPAAC